MQADERVATLALSIRRHLNVETNQIRPLQRITLIRGRGGSARADHSLAPASQNPPRHFENCATDRSSNNCHVLAGAHHSGV